MALEVKNWKEMRQPQDPETGLYDASGQPEWQDMEEVKATGDDVPALLGMMKDSAQASLQQAYNREQKFGVIELPDPDGNPVRLLGNEEEKYRAKGYGQSKMTTTFLVQGFGKMRSEGIRKQTIRYRKGESEVIYEEALDGTVRVGEG